MLSLSKVSVNRPSYRRIVAMSYPPHCDTVLGYVNHYNECILELRKNVKRTQDQYDLDGTLHPKYLMQMIIEDQLEEMYVTIDELKRKIMQCKQENCECFTFTEDECKFYDI